MNDKDAENLYKERRSRYNRKYIEKLHAKLGRDGQLKRFKSDFIHVAVEKLSYNIDLRVENV